MADTSVIAPPSPRRPRRWLRALFLVFATLVILLIVLYFIGTSSAFFKGVILPRVSKSINAEVTVADASISPFKEVLLHNLKVQSPNSEPLVTASEVRARYHLMDILGGNIHVEEIVLSSPTIDLVENPDGSNNLDPLLKSQPQPSKAKQPANQPRAKPPQIDLKKLSMTDATLRQTKIHKDGTKDVTELSHLNLTMDDLKNAQTGKLLLSADIKLRNAAPDGLLEAKLTGNFVFSLGADLKPASITGNTRVAVAQATGGMNDLASLSCDLDCEITPTDIKQVALRFQKGGTALGQIRVSGPFALQKSEGRLRVEILSIDKQILNLAGVKRGLDFGPTTLNSTNQIQIDKSGAALTASGQFNLNKFQLTRANQTTPSLDLQAQYDLTLDSASKTAQLRGLSIAASQNAASLLRAELTSPMNLGWGNATNQVGDSALNLSVASLNLQDWKPFLGDSAPAGLVNLKLKVLSQQAGKQLVFDLDSHIDNLTAGSGSNQITQANVTLQAHGQAADLKKFMLTDFKVQIARQGQSLLDLSGSGTYDQPTDAADLQLTLRTTLARVAEAMPRSDISISSGTAELKGHVTQNANGQTITGNLVLAGFTGQFADNRFNNFGTVIDLDIGKTAQSVQIRKADGKLTEGGNPGGVFRLSGTYGLTNNAAQLTATLVDFNENGLRPFLETALAGKKLVSVAINGSLTTQYTPPDVSAIKADLQLTNLVVSDPKGQLPATPLTVHAQIDAALHKKVADVRQFQVTLTPTQRAKNEIRLSGQVDMSQTNGYQGSLKLAADSLDLTSYADLFAGDKNNGKPAPTKPRAHGAAPAPGLEKEPEAIHLPFRNFTGDVNIGRLYFRELEVTNLQATARIDGGRVILNPFKLSLNGQPATANVDLDVGVPGFKYDVSFNLQSIPLAPLVNSFAPERKGQVGGSLTAQAKVSGTGTTGASLQKSLNGQFDVTSTNLNLSVVNVKNRMLKALINVVAAVPELLHNPDSAIGTLYQSVTGAGGGGLADALKRSPVDSIIARGVAGSGRVDLQQAVVESPAFRADAKGSVTLAEVLTNSPIHIPVSISLAHSLAQQVGMVSPDSGTNDVYVKLPDFYTMGGTVGDPKNDISRVALLKIAAKGLVGALPGGKTNGLLQSLTGILSNPSATSSNTAAGTNQPATNQAPLNNLLNELLKPKKK